MPDESFFHTILGNSEFAAKIRRHLHYEDWSEKRPSPAMIRAEHVDRLEKQTEVVADDIWGKSELLFTRKLSDSSIDLIDRIDRMIERKDRS